MNHLLRGKMQSIISRLRSAKTVTEAEIKLVRRSLILAKLEAPADLPFIQHFYRTVRKFFFQLRYPQSDKKVLVARPDRPAEEKLESQRVTLHYQSVPDPFTKLLTRSVPEQGALFTLRCQQLQDLFATAVTVTTPQTATTKANEIVATHRELLRMASNFLWLQPVRVELMKHLQAIYDRLEDYGWRCEAGVATGLPSSQANTLLLFLQTFTAKSELVLTPLPMASLTKVQEKMSAYEMKDNQLVLKARRHSTAETLLRCQQASGDIAMADEEKAAVKSSRRKRKSEDAVTPLTNKQAAGVLASLAATNPVSLSAESQTESPGKRRCLTANY